VTNQTVTVETQIPEDIYLTLQANGLFREVLAKQSRHLLALRFYQERILSLGKAARLAGLNRWEFIDFLGANNVPIIDYTDEELANEFAAVDQLATELNQ
jgi:predicted HTH domain antitoxin